MVIKSDAELMVMGYNELMDYLEDRMAGTLKEILPPATTIALLEVKEWVRIMELIFNKVHARAGVARDGLIALTLVLTDEKQREVIDQIIVKRCDDHNQIVMAEIEELKKNIKKEGKHFGL